MKHFFEFIATSGQHVAIAAEDIICIRDRKDGTTAIVYNGGGDVVKKDYQEIKKEMEQLVIAKFVS